MRIPTTFTFSFTLVRTRLQSTTVTIEARTAHEAQGLMAARLDAGEDFDSAAWSDGENEGAIDYDLDA